MIFHSELLVYQRVHASLQPPVKEGPLKPSDRLGPAWPGLWGTGPSETMAFLIKQLVLFLSILSMDTLQNQVWD